MTALSHKLKGSQRANLVRSTSVTGSPLHPPTLTLCAKSGHRGHVSRGSPQPTPGMPRQSIVKTIVASEHFATQEGTAFDITPHVSFAYTMSDIGYAVWFFGMGAAKLPQRKWAAVLISRGAEINCLGAAQCLLRPHSCARRGT